LEKRKGEGQDGWGDRGRGGHHLKGTSVLYLTVYYIVSVVGEGSQREFEREVFVEGDGGKGKIQKRSEPPYDFGLPRGLWGLRMEMGDYPSYGEKK